MPHDRPGHSAWRTPSSNLSVSGGTPGPSRHMTLDSSVLDLCEFRDFRQLPNVVTHARFRGLASWFPHGRSGGETALWPRRPSGTWAPALPARPAHDGRSQGLPRGCGGRQTGAQSLTTRGLVKLYEGDSGQRQPETRYSPAQCLGTRRVCNAGDPGPHHVSTSFAERQNLSMRMRTRGFTRLTSLTLRHYPIASHCPNVLLEQLPVFDRLYEDCSGGVRWVHDGRGTARSLRSTAGALRPAPPRRNRPR